MCAEAAAVKNICIMKGSAGITFGDGFVEIPLP